MEAAGFESLKGSAGTSRPPGRADAATATSLPCGAMRWHWTANEDNPDRVSYAEYARQTGADRQTVRESVLRHSSDSATVKTAEPVDARGGVRPKAERPESTEVSEMALKAGPSRADIPTMTRTRFYVLAAVAVLVLGVVTVLMPPVGIICTVLSVVAYRKSRRT